MIKIAPAGTKIPPKACRCGVTHISLPSVGKINETGLWFDCPCGSTLLIMSQASREKVERGKAKQLQKGG